MLTRSVRFTVSKPVKNTYKVWIGNGRVKYRVTFVEAKDQNDAEWLAKCEPMVYGEKIKKVELANE